MEVVDQLLHAAWAAAVILAARQAFVGVHLDRPLRFNGGVILAGLALGLPRELWDQSPWGPQKGPAPDLTAMHYLEWLLDPARLSKLVDLAGYSLGALWLFWVYALGTVLIGDLIKELRGKP